MNKLRWTVCCVVFLALALPSTAFGDAQTVNFDAYMQQCADFVYQGSNPYWFFAPAIADNNDPLEYTMQGNGMLDADEFALLSAIFANPSDPRHTQVHEAWKANVNQAAIDLGVLAGGLLPVLKYVMGAYATIGDGSYGRSGTDIVDQKGSWGWYAEVVQGMADFGSLWSSGAPDPNNYTRLPNLLAACTGDADGDGVSNLREYFGAHKNRATYIANALNAASAIDGGDNWGSCSGQPQFGSSVKIYYWNPTNKHVYVVPRTDMTWDAGEA